MDNMQIPQMPDFDLSSASVDRVELFNSIDYTRPLNEYPTASDIAEFIAMRDDPMHIYTPSLQVGGIAVQDAMEKYLASNEYYSSSNLKAALQTPMHLYYSKESGWKDELRKLEGEKKAFKLGTFIHMAILEPTRFSRIVVEPAAGLNSTQGVETLIAFWEEKIEEIDDFEFEGNQIDAETLKIMCSNFVEGQKMSLDKIDGKRAYYYALVRLSGITPVNETEKAIIAIIERNYRTYGDGIIPKLMLHSKREISMYAEDPTTCIKVRVRPDAIQFAENIGANTIISVKSTSCENLAHFYDQSAKYLYELSEGMYQEVASQVTGRDFNCTIMIMVQTVEPYGVAVLVWNAEDIEIGKYKYRQALQTVKECQEKGVYPGFDAFAESGNMGLINMKQPTWNAKELHPVDVED
jgi:hypothetical protein